MKGTRSYRGFDLGDSGLRESRPTSPDLNHVCGELGN